ncbi:MAG: VanZ family protein [Nitrospira sp.]|nr:VanZ family protein [Nitrospira sp.]
MNDLIGRWTMGIEAFSPNAFRSRSTLKNRTIWFLLVILAIAPLFPLSNFVGHPHWGQIRWVPFHDFSFSWNKLIDVIGNTLWFVVFGYLLHYQLNQNAPSRWTLAATLAIAGGVSLSAELFQVFCHNRISSITDVICNVLGAGLGGYAAEKQPATTSIEPWLARWLTPMLGPQRFHKTAGVCRHDPPLE